jgi:ankyrin repeat protein
MRTALHWGAALLVVVGSAVPALAQTASLIDAVRSGDRAGVTAMLGRRADVNAAEADGTTALHWAIRLGHEDLARQLVAAGANTTIRNRYDVTPLGLASESGSAELVTLLLARGADANTLVHEGETALMVAARAGNTGAVRALLTAGADPNQAEEWQGQTALMLAATGNHADVVRTLIEAGAKATQTARVFPGQPRLPRGEGVAIQAAHSNFPKGGLGALEAARVLAGVAGTLDAQDPDGITPLHLAIINAHFDLAALLVDAGADVNKGDRAGRTPLFMTADANSMEWLFSRPIPEASGELSALDLARRLLDKGADVNARLTGRPFILHHNATGNRNIGEGATAFMKAATTSDIPMMRLLLERGADPAIPTRNGTTPLMALAGLNWVEISSLGTEDESLEGMTILLERGADVNAANALGETALHGAAQRGANRIVEFLAERGAVLDVRNKDGRTPMDEARGQADMSAEDNVRRPEHKSTQALLARLIEARDQRAAAAGNAR